MKRFKEFITELRGQGPGEAIGYKQFKAHADDCTKFASESKSKSSHRLAREAHRLAAKKSPDEKTRQEHITQAHYHHAEFKKG